MLSILVLMLHGHLSVGLIRMFLIPVIPLLLDLPGVLFSMQQPLRSLSACMEKLRWPPNPAPSVTSPPPPSRCPRVLPLELIFSSKLQSLAFTANPNHLYISGLDLANKHMLWAPITSARVALPFPLDSCCSLSLVSKAHADVIAQKYPHLTFTKTESPPPVAVANPSSLLTGEMATLSSFLCMLYLVLLSQFFLDGIIYAKPRHILPMLASKFILVTHN